MVYNMKNHFGSFDLERQLTTFEVENFDLFMKPINHSIKSSQINLSQSVENFIDHIENYF